MFSKQPSDYNLSHSHLSLEKELNTLFGRIWYLYVLLQINELT